MAAPPPPPPELTTKGGLIGLVFALIILTGVGAAIAVPEMNRDDHKSDYDDHSGDDHDEESGDH